jgi:hypothetical protein
MLFCSFDCPIVVCSGSVARGSVSDFLVTAKDLSTVFWGSCLSCLERVMHCDISTVQQIASF